MIINVTLRTDGLWSVEGYAPEWLGGAYPRSAGRPEATRLGAFLHLTDGSESPPRGFTWPAVEHALDDARAFDPFPAVTAGVETSAAIAATLAREYD